MFDGGLKGWLLELGDMVYVVRPHPSMRGGADAGDKGRTSSYVKLCEFTLLFMNLQLEYRVDKDH